jgi:hypothetical protein
MGALKGWRHFLISLFRDQTTLLAAHMTGGGTVERCFIINDRLTPDHSRHAEAGKNACSNPVVRLSLWRACVTMMDTVELEERDVSLVGVGGVVIGVRRNPCSLRHTGNAGGDRCPSDERGVSSSQPGRLRSIC